jgi:hypothetical protein
LKLHALLNLYNDRTFIAAMLESIREVAARVGSGQPICLSPNSGNRQELPQDSSGNCERNSVQAPEGVCMRKDFVAVVAKQNGIEQADLSNLLNNKQLLGQHKLRSNR